MGKKQVRAQMRQVKRKPPTPGQLTQGTTRKQRERYVEAGGMLQGYAPDFVIRLGYIAVGVAVACLIVMAVLILVLRPIYGWADAIVAAVAWLVPTARLKQIPGNQVNVVLTVTPYLRHVRSVGIMGQRMVGRVEPPVPPVMRQLQRLPVLTPIALSLAVILGDDILAAVPVIDNETLH